jgi:(2Fe-2S) ferredoxin
MNLKSMTPNSHDHSCCCCCGAQLPGVSPVPDGVTRRQFLWRVGTLTAGGLALPALDLDAAGLDSSPPRPGLIRKTLKVQPVLTYDTPQRREATSWRGWGGIQTDAEAAKEKERIGGELARLKAQAEFPVEFLPLVAAKNGEQAAAAVGQADYDTLLLYAAGGWKLEALLNKDRYNLMFVRHEPGPVYLWYETVHACLLRKFQDEYVQPGLSVEDVVVDEPGELLWRLRALYGLKNTLGKRIVCIGGANGWFDGSRKVKAPEISRSLWKLDLVDYPYKELAPRLKAAFENAALVKRAEEQAGRLLHQGNVSLHTDRAFVNNAFVLTEVFKDIMDEAKTDAITVNECMGTIMPMSHTTACLPLNQLNDAGCLAFCESDFVVIPSGILLHYIAGKPVFLNDPTYPHRGVVTLAHCTAPSKMDGKKAERTKILTHFESDYGAAPKVEMKLGQLTTNLVPDFACKKWVGFLATIVGNPFLAICRSQIDVKVHGDAQALLEHMKGFHWMLSYGDYLRESSYALKKLGVDLLNVSAPKMT